MIEHLKTYEEKVTVLNKLKGKMHPANQIVLDIVTKRMSSNMLKPNDKRWLDNMIEAIEVKGEKK